MNETFATSDDTFEFSPWRNRLIVAGVLVLLLAVLALIPPLANVNRYQSRITQTLSASLGRPVHLDHVALQLLPVPSLTLTNFVVSEDPAFGSEPTIRANTVEAHLRLSSLWRRRIEVSRVRFVEPSVNLVRNPEGRWNLDNVLVHASRIDAAPTAQPKAGAAPRFPYIEATGARVNIKLGDEKMPFALTDADFALWLPTAQQWRVRLVGKPWRTDTNIGDPGTLRVEGTLQHAARFEDVPVDLRASWHDAPLGEATRLLTGNDLGWRGTVHIDASLQGPLGAAAIRGRLTVNDLRRADFVPERLLDVSATCTATGDAALAQLKDAGCSLPVEGGQPLTVTSPLMDLARPRQAGFSIDAGKLPLPAVFEWLHLLSPLLPQGTAPGGDLAAHLTRSEQQWSGSAQLALPVTVRDRAAVNQLTWNVAPATLAGCTQALLSPPTPVSLPSGSSLNIGSEVSACGYVLHLSGNGDGTELQRATRALPQLTEGLQKAAPAGSHPTRLDASCTRFWGQPQTCTVSRPAAPAAKKPAHRHR